VMYLGRLVEDAPTESLFTAPQHPYSRALLSSMLEPSLKHRPARVELHGEPGSPIDPPSGCRLHPRCPIAIVACSQTPQELAPVCPGHNVACMRITEAKDIIWPGSWADGSAKIQQHHAQQ
jgi:oligopeptide/dipeptide ABC transporter ATP-binding protein